MPDPNVLDWKAPGVLWYPARLIKRHRDRERTPREYEFEEPNAALATVSQITGALFRDSTTQLTASQIGKVRLPFYLAPNYIEHKNPELTAIFNAAVPAVAAILAAFDGRHPVIAFYNKYFAEKKTIEWHRDVGKWMDSLRLVLAPEAEARTERKETKCQSKLSLADEDRSPTEVSSSVEQRTKETYTYITPDPDGDAQNGNKWEDGRPSLRGTLELHPRGDRESFKCTANKEIDAHTAADSGRHRASDGGLRTSLARRREAPHSRKSRRGPLPRRAEMVANVPWMGNTGAGETTMQGRRVRGALSGRLGMGFVAEAQARKRQRIREKARVAENQGEDGDDKVATTGGLQPGREEDDASIVFSKC
ncbi:hypothetical protein K438DRAFT_1989225 [Mycena galopus ATCC 62051]|nr:hypothetical protein K438DRAFT_1989225 [Mycena galopus ATCC 62051]